MEKFLFLSSIGSRYGVREWEGRSSVLTSSGQSEDDRRSLAEYERIPGKALRPVSNPEACQGWHIAHLHSLTTSDTSVHCYRLSFSQKPEEKFCAIIRKVLPTLQLLIVLNEALLEKVVNDSFSQLHQAEQDINNQQYNILK